MSKKKPQNKWWEQDDEKSTEWQELKTPEGLTYYYNTRTGVTQWEVPDELRSTVDESKLGEWVWVPHPTDAYVAAKVLNKSGKNLTVQTEAGEQMNPKAGQTFPLQWTSLQRIVSDLTLLDDINAPLILHNLRKRFESDKIYTNLGTILISINPFYSLPLYGPSVIRDYQEKGLKDMPPHVYNIADNALKGILDGPNNQSIVVSGESGAGKTEATKQCLSYLASLAGSSTGVEQKILLSNPILESFGNSKTVRNNNSSRFGKYIEVYFDSAKEICGSRTTNFLLEKVRVIQQTSTERNFHIFYQLTKASTPEMRRAYLIGAPTDYYFTAESKCIDVDGISDEDDFYQMCEAMSSLNFSDQDQANLFQTVSAVLHIGNILFQETGDRKCRVIDENPVKSVAKLLKIKEDALKYALQKRTLKIKGQADTVVDLGADQAYESRNALAKFIYGNMFDWIVQKVNESMVPGARTRAERTIGILDIFGFEIFEFNSFEQLCINFTNEKLQQFFNANTFKLEEQLYQSEGVDFKHVDFIDNQPMLDLIEGQRPIGLLRILDEQVVLPRGSDEGFLAQAFETFGTCPVFKASTKTATGFVICHYAGEVNYETMGFLEKNRDTLTEDALSLLGNSDFKFIQVLFPKVGEISSKERKKTLGSQFRTQLADLMTKLYATEPHYIRCIKPNEAKKPKLFTAKNVFEQLTYSGVFEAVKIRKTGFPFRQLHNDFLTRYGVIFGKNYAGGKPGCQQLIGDLKLNPANVRMGKTMVLYRAEEYKSMELQRSIVVQKVELIDKIKELLKIDPTRLPNPDEHYEKISKAVKRAKVFNISDPIIDRARNLIKSYVESRIDPETKALLEEAKANVNLQQLEFAVNQADERGYETNLCKECKKLLERVRRIEEEAQVANYSLEEKHMDVVLRAAEEVGYYTDVIGQFRTLLYNTPKTDLLKILIQRCVEIGDQSRAIRITIRMKDMIFEGQSAMFVMRNFGQLKSAEEWAGEKFLTLSRDKLRDSQITWTRDKIHSSLTASVPKERNKDAVILFTCILGFMGDEKKEDPDGDGERIVKGGFNIPELRDEIYTQITKQLTQNPSPESTNRGWILMGACIATFPPTDSMQNFLEVFLKTRAPSKNYIGALHNICYNGPRSTFINRSQFPYVAQILQERTDEYAEKLPEGLPRYADLEQPYEPYVDEADFQRVAPNPVKQATKGKGAPKENLNNTQKMQAFVKKNAWKEYLDDGTGLPYYYNEETGESTWEIPAELKYALTTAPGVRV
eukprot:TRINITY_DN79370_c0_g1_i1.p1 TRINITY_DN79370_c0_g1~~TRINITY_DN79370_c0_g1_i1.p1  ORF type:complete len:1265 (-),score=404.92 TRINITY_DN79370_c0_g1_i1:50-3844(-)